MGSPAHTHLPCQLCLFRLTDFLDLIFVLDGLEIDLLLTVVSIGHICTVVVEPVIRILHLVFKQAVGERRDLQMPLERFQIIDVDQTVLILSD